MALSGGMIALLVLAIVGAALIIAGGVFIPVFKDMVHKKIRQGVALKNGSEAFDTWLDPPAPIYMHFYVFDVVNAGDVLANGSRPVVKEKGPFVYREVRSKNDLDFQAEGTLLRYKEPKAYVFDESLSYGSDSENFTSINLLLVKIAAVLEGHSILADFAATIIKASGERLLESHTVREYLFGYEDREIKKLDKLCDILKIPNCSLVGLFIKDSGNGSADGTYVIHTGIDNADLVNVIDTWNGNKSLNFWNTPYCNMINGTDGTMWHPFVETKETLYLFSSDICRSIYLKYDSSYKMKNKTELHRFLAPSSVFANHTENPDNEGFCDRECLGAGVLSVRKCKGNVPVVMSLPHFYQGADKYIHGVEGLHPDKKKHQTLIDVEPYTGATFNAHKRLQVNIQVTHSKAVADTEKIKNGTIFPLVWLDESATISDAGLHKFLKAVYFPITMTTAIQYGLIGLGALLLVVSLIIFLILVIKRRKDDSNQLKSGLLNSDTAGDE